ncbi:serine/threonine-protein kinase 11-interacting protein isoform X1 [Pleurodeles waltl]|uniref:serine/threonine-protein kinase 11-interacting protein isoform X1 n=2 Tax=Pleurodeles waltl TaxID=8319 RepID=UPI0037094F17
MGPSGSINGEDPRGALHLQPHTQAMSPDSRVSLVSSLSQLLQDYGHLVVDGTNTLTLLTPVLQHLTQLFEQHLLPRTQTHGFIALPSHPADSAAILQAQFLFDVLQKTPSLKLVHPQNCVPQSDVKVFPFKSLRCLELRSVPLHCLRGLQSLYSQLEVLTCFKCATTLEEILSLCGGDLSSALPWPELHTLNFSYNHISTLDDSLQLLNVLKVLDLSHNQIKDCGSYFLLLSDLVYLNLSYNLLLKVPLLSLGSRTQLVSLVLRCNDLDSINGVEQLSNLQHLDLALNLLMEHSQLAPLSQLHQLRKLHLEGNPLSFHADHRPVTVQHLSPRAVSEALFLDGRALSSADLEALPQSAHQVVFPQRMYTPEANSSEPAPLESSYAGDASDSPSGGDSSASKLPRKKSKVKVRKASISEPSDTEHTSSSKATDIVLHHQQDIARIDSFRDQFGADWLQYRHHLENELSGSLQNEPTCTVHQTDVTGPGTPPVISSESKIQEQERTPDLVTGIAAPPKDTNEQAQKPSVRENVCEREQDKEHAESMKQEEHRDEEKRNIDPKDVEVDLCDPIVVCPLLGKDPGDTEDDWIFLRVTRRHLIEVDLSNAQDLQKMELVSLLNIETSDVPWKWKGEDKTLPLLQLQFDYIRTDKKRLQYVVLDDSPEISVKTILQILYPVLEANLSKIRSQSEEIVKLQCLKCRTEFNQPPIPAVYNNEEELTVGMEEAVSRATPVECPACASDHVVILPSTSERAEMRSSTPLLPAQQSSDNLTRDTALLSVDPRCSESAVTGSFGSDRAELATYSASGVQSGAGRGRFFIGGEEETSEVNTSTSSKIQEQSSEDDIDGTFHSSSRSSETDGAKSREPRTHVASFSQKDSNCCSLTGSYRYGTPTGPTRPCAPPEAEEEETWHLSPPMNFMLRMNDFRTVDHRLKLYLDVEVFEDNMEEFQCFLQVPVVQFGKEGEFSALVVISEHRLYMMEITAEVRGPPSSWLRERATHQLTSLMHLEFGLWSQILHLEFENPLTSYSLLIRNQIRCDKFYQCFRDILEDLPLQHRLRFRQETKERVTRQHRLWPVLGELLVNDEPPNLRVSPHYFYLLAHIAQESLDSPAVPVSCTSEGPCIDAASPRAPGMALANAMIQGVLAGSPVTLIVTSATLYLLEETHQWIYSLPQAPGAGGQYGDPSGGEACLKEKQEISSISSLHVFRTADCHLQIRLYDETTQSETIWHLRSECPDLLRELVQWVKVPWEEMFHIKFNCVMHETLD